jgi:hypothetical protein
VAVVAETVLVAARRVADGLVVALRVLPPHLRVAPVAEMARELDNLNGLCILRLDMEFETSEDLGNFNG